MVRDTIWTFPEKKSGKPPGLASLKVRNSQLKLRSGISVQDREAVVSTQMSELVRYTKKLKGVFLDADTDGSGVHERERNNHELVSLSTPGEGVSHKSENCSKVT